MYTALAASQLLLWGWDKEKKRASFADVEMEMEIESGKNDDRSCPIEFGVEVDGQKRWIDG